MLWLPVRITLCLLLSLFPLLFRSLTPALSRFFFLSPVLLKRHIVLVKLKTTFSCTLQALKAVEDAAVAEAVAPASASE